MLFGEQSIASLPKKHCFAQKEALLYKKNSNFLKQKKRKSVLKFLFPPIYLNINYLHEQCAFPDISYI